MKHYIDLGTHKFEGLQEFSEKLNIDNSWSVYCYEANPFVYEKASELKKEKEEKYIKFVFENKAVLDENGFITFHAHKGAWWSQDGNRYDDSWDWGSNALDKPPVYDTGNGTVFDNVDCTVPSIDILDIFNPICENDTEAEIYIKCDIEGSEFAVLPRLLESPHINKIKKIFIEWHERFWSTNGTGEYEQRVIEKNEIIKKMESYGIECYNHS